METRRGSVCVAPVPLCLSPGENFEQTCVPKTGADCEVSSARGTLPTASETSPLCLSPGEDIENACMPLRHFLEVRGVTLPARWLALRLLEEDRAQKAALLQGLGFSENTQSFGEAYRQSVEKLSALGLDGVSLSDRCARMYSSEAERICRECITQQDRNQDEAIDRILLHRFWGGAVMVLLLALCLWLTISGANVPSELLSRFLFSVGDMLKNLLLGLDCPAALVSLLCDGAYRTAAWVVSVMLPPMAIFFPLFTLLEDLGVLPRVAFHLDGLFERCGACGNQGLTMCMGFGCNAAAVVGCRIIDSPRERLLAVITNSLVPCNGRFPAMIVLITVFFAGSGPLSGLFSALLLTALMVLGIALTFAASKLLSETVLRGTPSAFTLELPPYRLPNIGEVLVRSVLDRTLFVLGRAVRAAIPAGLLIWLLANLSPGGIPLLERLCTLLEPVGAVLGLDGCILLAFILGLPANEIVIPAMLMCYMSGGFLADYGSAETLRELLPGCGWTGVTAVCALLFTLLHWPCATTLMTIRKETGSRLYTFLSAVVPTLFGVLLCALVRLSATLLGLP